jgi:hypothetical protein
MYAAWRDNVWANRAYNHMYAQCSDPHPRHFKRGFVAGYISICRGEDGYVPAVPPRSYWGYAYQSADGQALTGSWFAGYPEGVQAALQEGAGAYRDVRVSAMLNAAMQPLDSPWGSVDPAYADPIGNSGGSEVLPGPMPQDPQTMDALPTPVVEPPIIPAPEFQPPIVSTQSAFFGVRGITPRNETPLAVPRRPFNWMMGR